MFLCEKILTSSSKALLLWSAISDDAALAVKVEKTLVTIAAKLYIIDLQDQPP